MSSNDEQKTEHDFAKARAWAKEHNKQRQPASEKELRKRFEHDDDALARLNTIGGQQ